MVAQRQLLTFSTEKPPYLPTTAGEGGRPTVDLDVPILAVLMLLYVGGAVGNMTIFQINRRKGHKFVLSAMMFGLCMSRILTCILRIVWATKPNDISVAITSEIFTNVGVLIIYIVQLLLALRLFRATHPRIGWNQGVRKAFKVIYVLLFVAICLVIIFGVLSFYTLNMKLRNAALWIERVAILYILLFNLLALVLLVTSAVLPRAKNSENFGTGSLESKMAILAVIQFFAIFDAGFRMGTNWSPERPASNPAWYDAKEAYYVILFGCEVIVIYFFIATRCDKRFHVPNGSSKLGHYSRSIEVESHLSEIDEKPTISSGDSV